MDGAHLLAFNLALLAALAVPGPAMLYALRSTLRGGRAAGVATGVGLGLMASVWTTLALLGLGGIFAVVPWAYGAMKIAGGLYLVWIAWGTWKDARRPLSDAPHPRGRAFLGGILVNAANPKSVLFAAAVIVVVFPAGLTGFEMALVVLNHFLLECLAYGVLALAFSHAKVGAGYLRLKPVIDRVTATLLGALGLRLVLDRG